MQGLFALLFALLFYCSQHIRWNVVISNGIKPVEEELLVAVTPLDTLMFLIETMKKFHTTDIFTVDLHCFSLSLPLKIFLNS